MTNLSDLLPAGAASKQLSFTADGAIASGQTVALQSNGTVKAISSTAAGVGSEVVFESANTQQIGMTYDTTNDKVVIVYRDGGNSDYGTAVVGTVSGKTISFGTPVVYESAASEYHSAAFDSTNGKVVVAYKDQGNSNYGTAIVGTVSGTSISFGSASVFESAISNYVNVAYDSTNSKAVISYVDGGDGDKGKAVVGTISGTSISFDSPVTFNNANTVYAPITFDSNAGKVVIAFRDGGNSNYGTAIVGTVSGTSISFGSEAVFESARSEYMGIGFDSTNNKVVVGYSDDANSSYATAVVGTVSGTSISFGTPVVAASSNSEYINVVHNIAANHMFYTFMSISNSNYGAYLIGTVSGTSISFTSIAFFNSARSDYIYSVYDPDQEAVVITYSDDGNSDYGTAIVYQDLTTNSSSFLGIADEAISNAASGKITMKGGVATNSQLLPQTTSSTFGSEVVFENSTTSRETIVYDTANDKVVIAYRDEGDSSKGKAVVGTVSGTSISFGTPVNFEGSDTVTYVQAAYDPDEGKVIITWASNSTGYLKAIIGTVSGTTMSFGSPVTYEASAGINYDVVYDTSNDKAVVCFKDGSNSNYGTSIVGTVSGTSISFGTKVVIQSANLDPIASVFDSTNNKVLFAYRNNSTNSQLIVGTVSGTSISFGSATTYVSGQSYNLSLAHDTSSGKNVLVYRDIDNSSYGTAVVATISGTSVSVGTAVVFNAASTTASNVMYDPTTNATFVFYKDEGNSDYGTAKGGIISGTDITFGTASIFNTANPGGTIASVKDPDQNKAVIAYLDYGNSQYGTAIVGTLSLAYPNLVPNTTYYVQTDGTLSTTSSTVTAGKAMSTNSINLDYST